MEISLHRFIDRAWDKSPNNSFDSAQTLIIIFAAARPAPPVSEELARLHQSFPRSILIGCSSSGEIYGQELTDGTIVMAMLKFNETQLKLAHYPITDTQHSTIAGRAIANELQDDDLVAIFTLTDGLLVNGSAFIDALGSTLPEGIIVTGGLAGDGDRFERTWVLYDGETQSGQVAAVGFYGQAVRIAHGSRGGWDLLGPEREVTRAEDNILYSLDGQPALQVYKKYLGDRSNGLPATGLLFPLAIRNEEETDALTVRTILAVDEQKQSITFAGDIPEGRFVRLMRANFDRLVDGAATAAETADMSEFRNGPALCIAISCVGRRLVLGPRVEEEIEVVTEGLPNEVQQIGYYSYGGISPLASGRCDLHNQTMTLTVIWENA